MSILLGFPVQIESPSEVLSQNLTDFPSTIGGLPIWLNPTKCPSSSQLTCQACSQPMTLLLQLYADDQHPQAYHRVIYVFLCKNGKCVDEKFENSIKVFRSQLPETNSYYNVGGNENLLQKYANLDNINDPTKKLHSNPFPNFELVSEEEPEQNASNQETPEMAELIAKMNITSQDEQQPVDPKEEAEEMKPEDSESNVDKAFLKFQKRIQRDPHQILRYLRSSTVHPPLFTSDSSVPPTEIPCDSCSGIKTCEFQIMPQILNILETDVDFASIFVYTCTRSCGGEEIIEEKAIKGVFSEQGLDGRIFKKVESKEEADMEKTAIEE